MNRAILLAIALSAAIGPMNAGEPKKGNEPPPLTSALDARKAFRAQVETVFLKTLPPATQKIWRERLAGLEDGRKWSVQRQSFAAAWNRVNGTLSAKEQQTRILYGTMDSLHSAKGECWTFEYLADPKGTLIGYLDAKSGRLVFLWHLPEG
jgi:hypothetical protein